MQWLPKKPLCEFKFIIFLILNFIIELSEKMGKENSSFGHCELLARTTPFANGEWNEAAGILLDALQSFGLWVEPSFRIESQRIIVETGIQVIHQMAGHHHCIPLDLRAIRE